MIYKNPYPKKRISRREQSGQIAIFNAIKPYMAHPMHMHKFFAFAVPNGGFRSKAEAGIMKGAGTMPGVSDIVVLFPPMAGGTYGRAAFVECKREEPPPPVRYRKDGTPIKARERKSTGQDPEQVEFQKRVESMGFHYHLLKYYGASDAVPKFFEILRQHGADV